MDFIFVQFLTGLANASSLFLVSAGLTVIFGVTRVVNFSHGSLSMLGAYVAWSVLTRLPQGPAWFVAGAIAASLAIAATGALLEITVLRRIYRAPGLLQLLATFGVVLILQDVVLKVWGAQDLALPRPRWMRGFVMIAGERFPVYDLGLMFVGPLALLALWLLLQRTRWGRLVRAATEDRDMVACLGVDQRLLFTSVFALGAGLAGLGGAISLPDASANLQMDLSLIADAFVVVVVGGMGSLPGAFLASVLIALLQAFGIVFFPRMAMVLVFAVMAVVLVVRPHGLLGSSGTYRTEHPDATVVRPSPALLRRLAVVVLAAAIAAPLVAGPFALSVLTEVAIAALFAASLHFMMGPGGMVSFGHAAWFGLGAYGAAFATKGLALAMPFGLVIAPLAAGIAALAFGLVTVRLSGIYLAMLTLAFAQIVWAVAVQWSDLTGGDDGVLGVWPDAWAADAARFYWLALALCVGAAMLLRRALYAPFGYALRASRDSPLRAEAIGIDTARIRLAAFTVAGAAAGLSGGLAAYSKGSVFPTYISLSRSVDALLIVLLGGVQTLAGPLVGALAYTTMFDVLISVTDLWRLVLGAAILLLVVAFPDGLAGAAQKIWLRGREA